MRVIAGKARRLPLKTVEGNDTRPTTDRIKETLFNMLQTEIPGCAFLDLFSGSGSIGIEALSRDARLCVFVENGKKQVQVIRENLKFTKLDGESAIVMECDVMSALSRLSFTDKVFDVVFMDPPYGKGHEAMVLKVIKDLKIVNENTLFIVEADLNTDFSFADDEGYTIEKVKTYKTNQHVFLRLNR